MDDDNKNKYNEIARKVLLLSRNTIIVNFRFLDVAISRLTICPYGNTVMCDGKYIFYNPEFIIKGYLSSKDYPTRAYMHMLMHCIFRHMFVSSLIDKDCWDIACDIAVENALNEFNIGCVSIKRQAKQQSFVDTIKNCIGQITAEKVYRYLLDNYSDKKNKIDQIKSTFSIDNHEIWYKTENEKQGIYTAAGLTVIKTIPVNIAGNDGNNSKNDESAGNSAGNDTESSGLILNSIEDWTSISEHIQQDIKTFSKTQGFEAGSFSQNLAELNREKYNYEAFLKKFAVLGEAMKINDDEFDYIFYTYGLKMYKNMPLIEPLEYKEVKRIKEFVIAIDTSGSVIGEEVQSFIQKTYNILKSTESFFSKINLHIIQCDADIQEHVKITSQDEFDEYIRHMQIKGLGGTDFRPIFNTVDDLINAKEFINLKGLIYFTDGYGTFPERKPDYETAFVFVNDDVEFVPDIPPWAIKLILQRHELQTD